MLVFDPQTEDGDASSTPFSPSSRIPLLYFVFNVVNNVGLPSLLKYQVQSDDPKDLLLISWETFKYEVMKSLRFMENTKTFEIGIQFVASDRQSQLNLQLFYVTKPISHEKTRLSSLLRRITSRRS